MVLLMNSEGPTHLAHLWNRHTLEFQVLEVSTCGKLVAQVPSPETFITL